MKKYKIEFNEKIYEVVVEELPLDYEAEKNYEVEKKDNEIMESEKINKNTESITSSEKEEIKAPMPGKILDVRVNNGEQVKKGQVLLILEAMKLENEIVSPRDGKVVSINTEKGDSVELDDLLMVLQ